jgi:ATP-dependent Clp protease ATP-binding subunit ClpC
VAVNPAGDPWLTGCGVGGMSQLIDLRSRRAAEARLGRIIGSRGYHALWITGCILLVAAIVQGATHGIRYAYLLGAPALMCYLLAVWWKRQLSVLPPSGQDLTNRLSVDVLARLKPGMTLQPQSLWLALHDHWQAFFITNHLLITREMAHAELSTNGADLDQVFQIATRLAEQNGNATIELGFVIAGLLMTSPGMHQLLTQIKAQPSDIEVVANWLGRNLSDMHAVKRNFGGIGRDWAFGFTPLLNRFGQNISLAITQHNAHFGWLVKSESVRAVETALSHKNAAVALVGPDGIGKTTSVYALAQRLIEGDTAQTLAYHQIIALNATELTSRARGPGDLEHIMISLASEAAHAGHIILFFDNAQMFFGEGHGSFDASQILLSLVQAHSVPMIFALSPQDFQRLKSRSNSLTAQLTPVVLQELPEADVMRILEDTAVGLENRHHILVAYEALREAYRLSGRYEQDEAYPGKAIKLLEQAINQAEHSAVTAISVQKAVEQAYGVKASSAAPAEADALLHLEDAIHARMVNQTHAVKSVASALRRARAGVTNPRRPIGSFLFLGPTGVGKTELARSIAATYFGSERAMIRLDMSEYQGPEDVQRLLATGEHEVTSLLMSVRNQPFSVVLLDEIEKAHPNILNLLLQLLDEGQLTDASGRAASFKDCIIIATSNAGAQTIRERVGKGESLESFAGEFSDELINSGQFKPELLNRFDEMVLFRPLNADELAQVVQLLIVEVNATLANQNISIELTPAATQAVVNAGNDPRLGARPMRRVLQRAVEDTVAQKILRGEARPGDHLVLDIPDLTLAS